MNIRYETDTLHNELIATITKPNSGDEYFMHELISKVTTGMADKFIDEFYPDIRELIDTERIHANIAEQNIVERKLVIDEHNIKHSGDITEYKVKGEKKTG